MESNFISAIVDALDSVRSGLYDEPQFACAVEEAVTHYRENGNA